MSDSVAENWVICFAALQALPRSTTERRIEGTILTLGSVLPMLMDTTRVLVGILAHHRVTEQALINLVAGYCGMAGQRLRSSGLESPSMP
jgi:hypothetical protein